MNPSPPLRLLLLCVTIGCSDSNSGASSSGIGGTLASGGRAASGGSSPIAAGGYATGGDRSPTGGIRDSGTGGYSSPTGGAAGSGTGESSSGTAGQVSSGGLRAIGGTTFLTSSSDAVGSGGASGGAVSGGSSAMQGGRSAAGGISATSGGTGAQQNSQARTGGTGAGGAGCESSVTERNRTLVSKAIDELFVSKDITAADRYWADPYLQHNPIAKSGVSTFRSLMGSLISSASFSYQRYLTLAECDLAVVYGRYSQSGVIFDMFRVKDDRIIEHWDSDANQASDVGQVGARDPSAASVTQRQLFLDFAATILVGADQSRVGEFLSADYVDHRSPGSTGPNALVAMLAAEKITYARVHHVIADGDYVFAVSEGKRGSAGYGFYDLFRAESSLFAEHWDSRRAVPANPTASGLGIF